MYTNNTINPMQDYFSPTTLSEAIAHRTSGARVLAGGTDLYPTANAALSGPILDLSRIAVLQEITDHDQGLRIGAGTTWATLAKADFPPALAALQQAALQIGGRQIQNAGTIGGNLCNASPAADGVPPLLVLGAEVELVSAIGTRRLPLADFISGPRQTLLKADEILLAIWIPASGLAGRSVFLKLGARAYLVISIAMVAAKLVVKNGFVTEAMLAVGSCSGVARRMQSIEALLKDTPVSAAAAQIRNADVAAGLAPIDDIRASADYRAGAAAELLRRAVTQVLL